MDWLDRWLDGEDEARADWPDCCSLAGWPDCCYAAVQQCGWRIAAPRNERGVPVSSRVQSGPNRQTRRNVSMGLSQAWAV